MRSNGENIAKETSNKLSGNRKSFGHLCRKALMHPPVPKNSHGKIPEPHFNYRNNPRKPSGKKLPFRIEARKIARCAITETEAALTGLLWRKNLSQAAFQSGSQTTPRTGAIRYRRHE